MAPLAQPATAAPGYKENPTSSNSIGSSTAAVVNPEDTTPSNISVISTNKEEGLETGPIADGVQEYDYPDGGLRGELQEAPSANSVPIGNRE
jgi:hypothetical protein